MLKKSVAEPDSVAQFENSFQSYQMLFGLPDIYIVYSIYSIYIVVCCSEKGLKVKKKCGGAKPDAPSCKTVCGIRGKPGGGGEGIFYSAKYRYI